MEEADWSTKLIRGLTSEAAAGFRSRRGLSYDDSAPVTPRRGGARASKAAKIPRMTHEFVLVQPVAQRRSKGGFALGVRVAAARCLCHRRQARSGTLPLRRIDAFIPAYGTADFSSSTSITASLALRALFSPALGRAPSPWRMAIS